MNVEEISFSSDGVEVAATLCLPVGAAERATPAVLTAPGFAGVKEMLIPDYAAAFTERGVAHLGFDYPGFGASGGSPRQQVDPPQQLRAFDAALRALARHPMVDPGRIGVWGTSLSGGHAIALAAQAPEVRAVAAVIPFIKLSPAVDPRLLRELVLDGAAALLRRPRRSIPVAGRPGEVAAMTSDGALGWVEEMAAGAPRYVNSVTVASLPKMLRWSIRDRVPARSLPMLVVLAETDTITPPALVRDALGSAPDVEWLSFPESHFELFTAHAVELRTAVVDWLSAQVVGAPRVPGRGRPQGDVA